MSQGVLPIKLILVSAVFECGNVLSKPSHFRVGSATAKWGGVAVVPVGAPEVDQVC